MIDAAGNLERGNQLKALGLYIDMDPYYRDPSIDFKDEKSKFINIVKYCSYISLFFIWYWQTNQRKWIFILHLDSKLWCQYFYFPDAFFPKKEQEGKTSDTFKTFYFHVFRKNLVFFVSVDLKGFLNIFYKIFFYILDFLHIPQTHTLPIRSHTKWEWLAAPKSFWNATFCSWFCLYTIWQMHMMFNLILTWFCHKM